ncbi:MAG TPA: replicative DNA helicase [Gemmatimonadales bacterium]|nr:replicative DNA helicase [Gemmatimonadales bacterium]
MSERTPPHDLAAEQAILGAILLHAERLEDAAALIRPEDFYRHGHQVVYRAMQGLAAKGAGIDLVTLREALGPKGLADAGGDGYLARLPDGIPRGTHVTSYARIVREKATLRRLIAEAERVLDEASEAGAEATALLDRTQGVLADLATMGTTGAFVGGSTMATELFPLVERLYAQKRSLTGVPSGLADLDRLTRGWQPSDLVILAARPSMGKTALALNVAYHAAISGVGVAIFSLEMSWRQLALRLLALDARLDAHRLLNGQIHEYEWAALGLAIGRIGEAKLFVDDAAQTSVPDLRAKLRRLTRTQPIGLVVLDYLQLMGGGGRQKVDTRTLELGEISRGLKVLARDLNVPILALSQLNRACELRQNKRPLLADLRESGALEQDADLVIGIYREEVYDPQTSDQGTAELLVLKHRNGRIGMVPVQFDGPTMAFRDLERRRTA